MAEGEWMYLESAPPPAQLVRRLSAHRPPPIELPHTNHPVFFSATLKADVGEAPPPAPCGRRRGKSGWATGWPPWDESSPPAPARLGRSAAPPAVATPPEPGHPTGWMRVLLWGAALCGGLAAAASRSR